MALRATLFLRLAVAWAARHLSANGIPDRVTRSRRLQPGLAAHPEHQARHSGIVHFSDHGERVVRSQNAVIGLVVFCRGVDDPWSLPAGQGPPLDPSLRLCSL